MERPDDFDARRDHLVPLDDEQLHRRFWDLVEQLVAPLVEQARTHTSPAIERSVLLRMGLSSLEAKALVEQAVDRGLLGHGVGRLLVEASSRSGLPLRDAAVAMIEGRQWEGLVS